MLALLNGRQFHFEMPGMNHSTFRIHLDERKRYTVFTTKLLALVVRVW
jgi:hypothetical protein